MREGSPLARIAAGLLASSINLVMIALVVVYVLVKARGGISLDPRSVAEQVRALLWFSLLCGLASFATIEILKRVFGLRGLYQRRQTQVWLDERMGMGKYAF